VRVAHAVGEHSRCVEAVPVRGGGAAGRENVGMSNHNPNEKLGPRKSKVSVALAINHGLVGPKSMVKTADDGQTVNIPSLLYISMEGRGSVDGAPYWFGVLARGCAFGKSGALRLIANPSKKAIVGFTGERSSSGPSRKTSKVKYIESVP